MNISIVKKQKGGIFDNMCQLLAISSIVILFFGFKFMNNK